MAFAGALCVFVCISHSVIRQHDIKYQIPCTLWVYRFSTVAFKRNETKEKKKKKKKTEKEEGKKRILCTHTHVGWLYLLRPLKTSYLLKKQQRNKHDIKMCIWLQQRFELINGKENEPYQKYLSNINSQ